MQRRAYSAISPWLMREYMDKLGATQLSSGEGDTLEDNQYHYKKTLVTFGFTTPITVASISIKQLEIIVKAIPEGVPEQEQGTLEESVMAELHLKAIRGGG